MIRRFVLTLLAVTTFLTGLSGQTELGKYAGEFMAIDVSARAQAMGGAFGAISDDVFAAFYNPAGLAQVQATQVGFTHTQQFLSSVNYDYIGFAKPFASGKTFGASLIRLGIDDIQSVPQAAGLYDEQGILRGIDFSQVDNFNAADYVFFVSMGQQFSTRMLIGFNAKLVRRDLGSNSATGIGFDGGLMFRVNERLKVSAMVRNLTTTLIAWDTGRKELVSPSLRLGSAYRVPLPALNGYFIPNVDVILQTQSLQNLSDNAIGGAFSGAAGGELVVMERLALRGGYDELQRINFGVGIRIPHIDVDYSFTGYDQELGNAHRIGLMVNFAE